MDKSRSITGIAGHALVLGGSGGLGAEIVRTLAASGASAVSFTYGRNKKAADELVAELRADGIKAFAAQADLSDDLFMARKRFQSEQRPALASNVRIGGIRTSPDRDAAFI